MHKNKKPTNKFYQIVKRSILVTKFVDLRYFNDLYK